ncbi:MAG: Aminomethyltransferase [Pseudomonadota bacterium]
MHYRSLQPRDQLALDAALGGAALFGRDDQLAVVARGKHHRRFLHALLTAPFAEAPADRAFAATLTDAQGRLYAAAEVETSADAVTLWVGRGEAQLLIDRLMAHRVAERVTLTLDESLARVAVVGPRSLEIASEAGLTLPEPGAVAGDATRVSVASAQPNRAAETLPGAQPEVRITLPRDDLGALVGRLREAGAAIGCLAAAEVLRVCAGVPRIDKDVPEGSTPWEAGLADAVSLEKGCYLGQEALAMQAWRGQLRRHLCWVEPTGEATPEAGALLRDEGGRRAGHAGSGVVFAADGTTRALGLAMVSRKAAAPGAVLQAEAEGQTIGLRVLGTTREGVFAA